MRETVGKISSDLIIKQVDDQHSAHEQMQESLVEWDNNIWECVDRYAKQLNGDFYVVVITKKERLMGNVIRNFFTGRLSCPTPEWDQVVYRYHKGTDTVELLWVIPSKDTCEYMRDNMLNIDPEERELLMFVIDFFDGTLFDIAKKLNGERIDSPLLEN